MPAASVPWWQHFRTVGPATVLHVDLAPDPERERAALTSLDEGELSRWRRFEYAAARRRFVLMRAALRAVLCRDLACGNDELAFEILPYGKPFAMVRDRPAAISFSASHGGEHGLIAIAPEGRLGVDVEERANRRRLDLLVDAALGNEERAELESRQGSERLHLFFRLWTMKEALLKAHGAGFRLDPTSFEIPGPMRHGETSGEVELPAAAGVVWRLDDLGDERFAAAIAQAVDARD